MDLDLEVVDRERTPLGELVLRRYRAEDGVEGYEILLDGSFLMASHGSSSERAMAVLAHGRLPASRTNLTALVGGLGAGHTLRSLLDLSGVARVVVVEIGRRVVDWNRQWFAAANGRAVDDPRVEVVVGDVADTLAGAAPVFDLILLDVDNGPGWLAAPANRRIYGLEGLNACRLALTPGGVLAVWSPARNAVLAEALRDAFGSVETCDTSVFSRAEREPPSFIYIAKRLS